MRPLSSPIPTITKVKTFAYFNGRIDIAGKNKQLATELNSLGWTEVTVTEGQKNN